MYRATITGLMAFVLCVGLGLAALRNSDRYWAAGTYNFAALASAGAIVCAFTGWGRVRAIATGFAVFALTYLVFNMLPRREVNMFGFGPQNRQSLLIETDFVLLQPHLKPVSRRDTQGLVYYDQVAQSLGIIMFGGLGALFSGMVVARQDRRRSEAGGTDGVLALRGSGDAGVRPA